MKTKLLLLLTLCYSFIGFSQTEFEEVIIIDQTYCANGATSVYSVDIDGDGDMDVLSASELDDKIAWYENNDGQGNFGINNIITTSADGAQSVYAADIDGDGDMDVLSASELDDKIAWYENTDGQGTFSSEQIISVMADGSQSVYAGDIDGDGDMDVLSASELDDKIAWYENIDGQGTFNSEQIISNTSDRAQSVYASDIDGDGDIDVLSASYNDDKIAWYENTDGQGAFSSEQIISVMADGAKSVYSVDIDGDGDRDVLSASQNDYKIAWYENTDGQGTFSAQNIISNQADYTSSVHAADMDGDGDMDILSLSYLSDKVFWHENTDGQGTFGTEQVISLLTNNPTSIFTSDIDGDGDLDVLSASSFDDKIAWYENTDGQGALGAQRLVTLSISGATSVFASDIDGDGDMDIISSSVFDDKIAWYENIDGLVDFSNLKLISQLADNTQSVYASDIDGDGDVDVLSASYNDDKIAWYENTDGQGTFDEGNAITFSANGVVKSIFSADFDGDGDMDVVAALTTADRVSWFENTDGLGNFSFHSHLSTNADGVKSVYAADMDGDGDLDVLSASENNNEIVWYENNGFGSFNTQHLITNMAIGVESVYAGDIDGDGDIDVLSALSDEDKIAWYENIDSSGSFGSEQIITTIADNAKSVSVADIDNDGDLDVLSASYTDNKIAWYENTDGLGSFGSQQIISSTAIGALFIYPVDIDNDGDIDVLSASIGDYKIALYNNLQNKINGIIKFDADNDGCSVSDISVSNIMVVNDDGINNLSTFSSTEGFYQFSISEGDFTTSLVAPDYYTSTPDSYTSNFTEMGSTDTVDFCLEPLGVFNDLNISFYPNYNARPGFPVAYNVVYKNVGTTTLSGSVDFEYDNTKLQFLFASETIVSQTSNMLSFDFVDLNPFESRGFYINFSVLAPPITEINDILSFAATVNPVTGDETGVDNVFNYEQTVVGSYDPNDIQVLEGEQIYIDEIDKYLHYIIRFQNTGTASAINVKVNHVLDNKLDWTTMQLESMSHDGRVEIIDGNNVDFIFNNINLPDSTNDEPNSHGFIAFKIKPKQDVAIGDIINGVADIYFDFNLPITTNTVATEIVETLSVNDVILNTYKVYPNPAESIVTIQSKTNIDVVSVYDINGRLLSTTELPNSTTDYELQVDNLSEGLYFLEIKSGNAVYKHKFIKK